MIFAGDVGDWHQLANINDPLPLAMKAVVGERSGYLHMLVWIGLFGLVASFHGVIMGYSRQIFALARAGFLPRSLSTLHPRLQTPARAIVAGGIVGIIAVSSDKLLSFRGETLAANIVTISAFGALIAYVISMLSLFRLRRLMPGLERPFKVPLYPLLPAISRAPLRAAANSIARQTQRANTKLRVTPTLRAFENTCDLPPGGGLWGTITSSAIILAQRMNESHSGATASRRFRLTTASIAVAAMTGEYSLLIMPFILAAMMQAFRLSEATAGRLVSLQMLGMAIGSALVSLVLRPGRSLRAILVLAAGAIVVANASCAVLDAPLAIGGARALTGLGEGAIMAAAGAAACAMPDPHRVFSVVAMSAAVIAIVALTSTPFLVAHAGPSGLFCLLALTPVLLFTMLRWIPAMAADAAGAPATIRGALRHGSPLLLACLAFWSGSSGLWVYAERIGAFQGMTPEQMGFWLSLGQLGALPGPLASAWAVPRFGVRPSLVVGSLGMAAAVVSFIFGGYPWTYGLGGFLASFWLMFVVPCFRSRMAMLDPSGRTVALSVGIYTVGFGIAPLVVASITVEGHGYAAAGGFCVMCFIVSAALGGAWAPSDRSRGSDAASDHRARVRR